jgi:cyanamide hydratase
MEELGQADRTTGHGHHSLLDYDTHGWTAVPRSLDVFLKDADQSKVKEVSIQDLKFPATDVVKKTREYVQQELPEPTFNHSMRVFCWGESFCFMHLLN